MLDKMRQKRNSAIIIFFFAIIILVFVFWGVGTSPQGGGGNNQFVAVVNGTKISAQDYSELYRRQLDYYRETFKDKFDEKLIEQLNVSEQVLNTLVERQLMIDAARSEGVRVSAREIQDRILSNPMFQRDGVFNKELYFAILSSNRIEPAEYEQSVKSQVLIDKLMSKVLSEMDVTEEDVLEKYMRDNRDISLYYTKLSPADFVSKVDFTEDVAKKYLEQNSMDFMEPEKVKALYAFVDKAALESKVEVAEEDIKRYYELNQGSYIQPKEVKARHILIRPKPGADNAEQAKEDARKKTEEILDRISAGEDFASLAEEFSQDSGSAVKGGDLGYFREGQMVKPFEEAAFSLSKGEVSDVVETRYGFHLIKVENIKGGKVTPLSEARSEISGTLAKEKAAMEGREIMAELHELFTATGVEESDIEALQSEASDKGVKTRLTPLYSREDAAVELNKDDVLKRAAFSLSEGESSGIIETDKRLYIIKILERAEAHVKDYKAVSEEVNEALKMKKADEMAREEAERVLDLLSTDDGASFVEVVTEAGYEVGETGFFTFKQGYIPELGIYTGDREDLFELSAKDPNYDSIITHVNEYYLVSLRDSREADKAGFEANKQQLISDYISRKEQELQREWIEGLRKDADIEYNEEYL